MKIKPNIERDPVRQANLSIEGLEDIFQPPRLSKPEMHLLLKPYFLLDRHADRYKPIEYVYSAIENGKAVTRSWWVEPHSKYGLPGPFDRDVCIALHEIVYESYLSKNLFVPAIMPIGSMTDFLRRMGLSAESGKNIASLKESLHRLKATLIDAQETFFNNRKKCYVSLRITLLKGLIFTGDEDGNGGRHEQNFVIFDETILSNLNTGYVMVIDVESLRKLTSNIARQLRTHLHYRFFVEKEEGRDCWVADYQWLAIHLGIKMQNELRRAKDQLKDAHEELKQTGYIADYQWDGWRIIYRPGEVWKGEQLRRQSGKAKHPNADPVQLQLFRDSTIPSTEPRDPLIGALVAFAANLTIGEDRIKALGLTHEQAVTLCEQKNIPIHRSSKS